MDEWIRTPALQPGTKHIREVGVRYRRPGAPPRWNDLTHWSGSWEDRLQEGRWPGRGVIEVVDGPGGPYTWTAGTWSDGSGQRRRDAAVLGAPASHEHLLGTAVGMRSWTPPTPPWWIPGRNGVFPWTLVGDGRVVGT